VARVFASILLLLAAAWPATAGEPAPLGICLVALEPGCGDDEVAGIPFCRASTTCCSYKLVTPKGTRIEIPDNRFRGFVVLPTRRSLREKTPERELARLEEVARRYPLAASSFSAQLDYLRRLVENRRAASQPR
jgi:hypothetical protein